MKQTNLKPWLALSAIALICILNVMLTTAYAIQECTPKPPTQITHPARMELTEPLSDRKRETPTIIEPELHIYPTITTDYHDYPANDFKSIGVLDYQGWRVTYYNPLALGTPHDLVAWATLGTGHDIYDRGDGIAMCNGYVAIALPANYEYGILVDTPFGMGMCVDHSEGALDVMVYWETWR